MILIGNCDMARALMPTQDMTVLFRVSKDVSTGRPALVVLAVVTYRICVLTVWFLLLPW
jgi:hypothetical protein